MNDWLTVGRLWVTDDGAHINLAAGIYRLINYSATTIHIRRDSHVGSTMDTTLLGHHSVVFSVVGEPVTLHTALEHQSDVTGELRIARFVGKLSDYVTPVLTVKSKSADFGPLDPHTESTGT